MKVRNLLTCLLLLLSILGIACDKNAGEPNKPNDPAGALEDVFALARQNTNLLCLIVYKDDHILKEQYFRSTDSSSPHDVRSVTKSIMSTLIGIAIDKRFIASEDQKIGDYIRPLVGTLDSSLANITIRNVLTMSTGLSGNDLPDVTEYDNWYNASNQLRYTINKPLMYQPGQVFGYNTGASHLTSVILTQAAGMSTFQFARQYLFGPLGISDHSWQQDKQGFYNGGAGLSLTPHDMLKIGRLYLQKGMYNGFRVVSEEWIEKASTFKITTNGAQPFGPSYGFFWWVSGAVSHRYFFANGYGGQFIVVVPDLNLVVVAANTWSNVSIDTASRQWYSTIDLIMNRIIPLYE
jgi:CubicO group peptidase (beta-lactamase class C family)